MWTKSKSLHLTYVLVCIVLVLLIVAVFLIPMFARWYDLLSLKPSIYEIFCVVLYASLIPAYIAMWRLCKLLKNIKTGVVFTKQNSDNLRSLSYCCFAECVVFFAFGFIRPMSFLISFAACLFGLILRVLKNVFEQAIELREENDGVI